MLTERIKEKVRETNTERGRERRGRRERKRVIEKTSYKNKEWERTRKETGISQD